MAGENPVRDFARRETKDRGVPARNLPVDLEKNKN